MNSICQQCNRPYFYRKRSGHSKTRCNTCVGRKSRDYRNQKCVDYKGGKCQKCGYDACIAALHFHHRNPAKKLFNISQKAGTAPWEELLIELDKCDLLCANCHAELHYKEKIVHTDKWLPRNFHIPVPTPCKYCKQDFLPVKAITQYCSRRCFHGDTGYPNRPSREQMEQDFIDFDRNKTEIGKKYGVSGTLVRQWAENYQIE